MGGRPEPGGTRWGALARASRELGALFEEVADVDWRDPRFTAFVRAIALSEALSRRDLDAAKAADAFVSALAANSSMSADTFMAVDVAPTPKDPRRLAAHAATRARAVAGALRTLDRVAPDQRLLQAAELDRGWIRMRDLDEPRVRIAFVHHGRAYTATVDPDADDDRLERALRDVLEGRVPHALLSPVDERGADPTPAAAAVALEPVSLTWARSFHRLAWTRGGGPWMGVADCPPYAVVSTCHAAIDGYLHARVTSAVLESSEQVAFGGERRPLPLGEPERAPAPPMVGFATARLELPTPSFATALHAFGEVLERRLGRPDPERTRSVPFHVPIAPGHRTDSARWRRRPLYGLLALTMDRGELEPLDRLRERLPGFLAREAEGRGVLTRVLRSFLELPLPERARHALIMRQSWADRWVPPAQVLTGGGYFSWMRFAQVELPQLPTYPSAVPSFAADRGGAGLSIAQFADGIAVGLTTGGSLGTTREAESFLDEWRGYLDTHHREAARIA
ncbi:MAG: hypothetical protein AB7S26_02855 [Sandaracinaceae bacterium]